MTTLVDRVLDSVQEQKNIIALKNCFHTWDGSIDADVIVQGLHDRFKAIGRQVDGIRIRRMTLNSVRVEYREEGMLHTLVEFREILDTDLSRDVLNPEEVKTMRDYLMNNFHH